MVAVIIILFSFYKIFLFYVTSLDYSAVDYFIAFLAYFNSCNIDHCVVLN